MEKSLKNWLKRGLIGKEKYEELLLDYQKQKQERLKASMQITMYTIGAILLGTGIILFIASNTWLFEPFEKMFKFLVLIFHTLFDKIYLFAAKVAEFIFKIIPARLFKIAALLCLNVFLLKMGSKLAYEEKTMPKLGASLIFLSAITTGGLVALLGQIYNIESGQSPIWLFWLVCILPLMFVFKSKPVGILSALLFSIVYFTYFVDWELPFYFTLLSFAVILYTISNIDFFINKLYDISFFGKSFALIIFYTAFLFIALIEREHAFERMLAIAAFSFLLLILNFINYFFSNRRHDHSRSRLFEIETSFIAAVCVFVPILYVGLSFPFVAFLANSFLIFMISVIYYYGYKMEKRGLVALVNKFTVVYLIIFYARYLQEYLEGALFFIAGGLLLIGSAVFLEKKLNKIPKNRGDKE